MTTPLSVIERDARHAAFQLITDLIGNDLVDFRPAGLIAHIGAHLVEDLTAVLEDAKVYHDDAGHLAHCGWLAGMYVDLVVDQPTPAEQLDVVLAEIGGHHLGSRLELTAEEIAAEVREMDEVTS